MAVIAPLIGAGIGGIATGWATWGMSAGWLVGSWLFGSKSDEDNRIFDPGAEEMPRFNQALRGVTMPILFGTNRVAPNIIWQKNFSTIRHESQQGGGGGKGGGSGMGGKAGGPQSTNVSYEYKWDLLYHLGMADSDLSIIGGWLASERLNDETILAISGSDSLSVVSRPQSASLTFDEAFFHGSNATSDTNAENWTYFSTEEDGPYRWPYTSYIGFKQLNLGASARIPQLSFEIGPGNFDLIFNSNFIDYWDSATITAGTSGMGPSGSVIKGDDGNYYQVDAPSGNYQFRIRNCSNRTTLITKTDTEFDSDCTDYGLDPGSAYDFTASNNSWVIPGTNYILAHGYDIGLVTRSNHAFLLYKINSVGGLEVVGGYQGRSNSLEGPDGSGGIVSRIGSQSDSDPIILFSVSQVGADFEPHLFKIPSVSDLLAGPVIEDSTSNNFEDRTHSLRNAVTEIASNFGKHFSYRKFSPNNFGLFLPTATIDPVTGAVSFKTLLCFYIGKSDIEWHIDNPADLNGTQTIYDITGTHPNGGIFSVTIDNGLTDQALDISDDWTDISNSFVDYTTGSAVIPFDDSGFSENSTTEDGNDYDPSPQMQVLNSGVASGGTLIVFWKNIPALSSDADLVTGTWTKGRVFIWNPLSKIAKQYGEIPGSFADAVNDWGHTDVEHDYTTYAISGFYDEISKEILIAGYITGGDAYHNIFLSKFGDFSIGGGGDVLPPYIIHQILTSPIYGIGVPVSAIDSTSYNLALQYCDSEDIRVSVQYLREESVLSIIDNLLSLYGGFLIDSGGTVKFGLQEFTSSPVRTIDNDHLMVDGEEAPVRVTKGARQDTYNRVKVNYFDRALEYRQNFIEISDEVDQDLNGVRPQEFPPKFVMSEKTALKLASRALWGNLYARDIYDFKLGPKDADLEPGDVVTLVDSFNTNLSSGKQVRIVSWMENEPLMFSVRAVDEIEYVNNSAYDPSSVTQASSNPLFGPASAPANFTMYELPKEFQGADARLYVGYRQQSAAMGARLYLSADGVSYTLVDDKQPYIISGIMAGPLPSREPGYVEENIEVYLMPDTRSVAFDASSPTYCQTFALDDVGVNGRALGAGLMWTGSEMIAYEGVNLLAQNHYRFDKAYRGWGGTLIHAHNSGDTWHKHGGGVFANNLNSDKIGSIVHYKVAPYNFAGIGIDPASIDARTYQIQGTFFRPQNQAPLRTYVQSPGSYLTIQSEDLGFIRAKNVVAGGSPIQIEWPDSSRDSGYGAQGYGTGGYGRFATDITSINWMVEVLSSDLSTVVRCTTVGTTAFNYSTAANSADWSGWNGNFAVRITPFNEFGTALRSRIKVLELYE